MSRRPSSEPFASNGAAEIAKLVPMDALSLRKEIYG